jgi:membrane protein DedA with SNARE-associated domain
MAQHFLDLLRSALVEYGYWAVAAALLLENAGVPVPGETILLMASFLAYSEHTLQIAWIVAVGTVAATIGDNLGFAIGYYGGRPLLERYWHIFRIRRATLTHGEQLFARYGAATVFVARFIFGMRIIAGPMAGVLQLRWQKFVVANFLGAALWVSVISGAGYLFGQHWERLARDVKRFDLTVAALIVLTAAFLWWRGRRET